jgi:multiple antibiotic resistance protein
MRRMLTFALTAFSAIFSVMDPFGVVPVYLATTASETPASKHRTARRACVTAIAALVLFALTGSSVLAFFGISLGAFRIAGGLLLFLTSLDMLRAEPVRQRTSPEEEAEGVERLDVSIFPLAFPMLAGPGSIATVLLLMSRATSFGHKAIVLACVGLTGLLTFGVLLGGAWAERRLGKTGLHVLNRVMGLLLAGIAVQFILDGLHDVLPDVLPGGARPG